MKIFVRKLQRGIYERKLQRRIYDITRKRRREGKRKDKRLFGIVKGKLRPRVCEQEKYLFSNKL